MKIDIKNIAKILKLSQSKSSPNNIEILLSDTKALKDYSSLEFTFFMYPYSKELNSKSFNISPYEEYIRDVNMGRRSMYGKMENIGDNIFGILLGIAIFLFFWIFNKDEIFSIEAVVSIFAAYTIGKELWNDLDHGLTNWTQNWKLSWRDNSYYYVKQDFGSIQKFWKIARKEKYKTDNLLAHKVDFLTYSNSKTVELLFRKKDLKEVKEDSINIIVISFEDESMKLLKPNDFMFGTKITLIKNRLFWKSNIELSQSISKKEYGAVSKDDTWQKNSLLVRQTVNIGRLKLYRKSWLIQDIELTKTTLPDTL